MLLHELLDERAARRPGAPALSGAGAAWSLADLRRRSEAYARWLRDAGVGRGDRVLVVAPHAAETVTAVFAAARLGALYVVVSDQVREYGLRHILRDCAPRVVLGAGGPGARAFAELPAEPYGGEPLPPAPCLSIDPAGLIYTSGSTALPKAVVSTHGQILFATRAIQQRLAYRPDDVVFCGLPLSFDYGLYQVYLSITAGAGLVLGGPDCAGPSLLRHLTRARATVLPLVPTLAAILVRLVRRAGRPPDRLRLVTNTGAALPATLAAELREVVPAAAVVSMFGLTECKRVCIGSPDGDLARPGSVGTALADTEMFIVDDGGRRLPPGEVGELVVRGPHVMAGYWRAPGLTARRFRRDEFGQPLLFTGDRCRMDRDGHLYFVGRADEVYKSRGMRVGAAEVEAAALDIPGVESAALLPPGPDHPAVLAVTGAGADLTPDGVRHQLAARLEGYKVPDECRVLPRLPVGPHGKVDKRALRAALTAPLTEPSGAAR